MQQFHPSILYGIARLQVNLKFVVIGTPFNETLAVIAHVMSMMLN